MKQSLSVAYKMKRKDAKPDSEQFLSAEEGSETPFNDMEGMSDEEELDESGFNPEPKMDNSKGNPDQSESRNDTLRRIMSKVRRQHMKG